MVLISSCGTLTEFFADDEPATTTTISGQVTVNESSFFTAYSSIVTPFYVL